MSEKQLLQAIAVTAEMTGTTLSPGASRAMFDDLRRYPESQVLAALVRCRRELKGRLTLADVLTRLEDGRPGAEEAWATVSQTRNEGVTVVWTEEMRKAAGVAYPLMQEGDMVAARMSFLESYKRLVQLGRDLNEPPRWSVSLGHDAAGREGPIREAVEKGRLALGQVQDFLPQPVMQLSSPQAQQLKRITEKRP